jgi:hypothetical protein
VASSLTWLDQDAAARDRSLRILALFREKESRDELGIGGVRDAIADRLFPGTSTIQTRIRYMLLVPWMYQGLERRRVPASTFGASARQAELAMVRPLLDAREEGVFGAQAGADLKRLPSSVYWAGLGTWGIRRYPGSQGEYHSAVDLLYARRRRHRQRDDDTADADEAGTQSWHPRLPAPPDEFPTGLNLRLTRDEASFLRDRIVTCCKDSLLAWLVLHGHADQSDEPWLHHQFMQFPTPIRALLGHARLFTDAIEGAARLYNLCLAELRQDDVLALEHRDALGDWRTRCDLDGIRGWSLDGLWEETLGQDHTITPQTRRFVTSWVDRVRETGGVVAEDAQGRQLVRSRERSLKGHRSRFDNRGALAQWSGSSGVGRLVYRWPTARGFLGDLLPALAEG